MQTTPIKMWTLTEDKAQMKPLFNKEINKNQRTLVNIHHYQKFTYKMHL